MHLTVMCFMCASNDSLLEHHAQKIGFFYDPDIIAIQPELWVWMGGISLTEMHAGGFGFREPKAVLVHEKAVMGISLPLRYSALPYIRVHMICLH